MLHHIEINVSDLNKAIEFWDWFLSELNYEVYQKWDSGISWKFENTYLVFVQTHEKFIKAGYHRSQVGLNHLAFYADSREQVDQMTEKLKERNLTHSLSRSPPFCRRTRSLCCIL